MDALPPRGIPSDEVLAELAALRGADLPTKGGQLFAYVYDAAVPGLEELQVAAYAGSAAVNGLDPTAFPSLLATENALVAAAARLLGGDGATVGTVTSGGTESVILAVKAARDSRPDIAAPRLVVPATAHAAFAKAASYLRVHLDPVPVDPLSLQPDPAAVATAITRDTVLVVASAPSYAHGVVDPVADIAAVAAAAGVRAHVDACFGGWVLPYLRRLGADIPPFGFEVDGVTSVSVDLHKYAYAAKGVSILLHRDASYRLPQYFAYADWPGYTMVNAGIASTRSGGPVAAAYATLRHLGDDGYLELARRTRDAVAVLADAVRAQEPLRLMVEPLGSVVCFTSDEVDLYMLADEPAARGWFVQAQLPYADLPASIHLSVTASVAATAARFAHALEEAVAVARTSAAVPPELLAAATTLAPEALTPELVAGLAQSLGLRVGEPGAGPIRMAPVNTILASAPPRLREALLTAFMSHLQTPS